MISASGSYMLATTKFKQPDMVAHIVSPYILAGDNTCIQVYYQTQGGILNIRTVATDKKLTTGMYWTYFQEVNLKGFTNILLHAIVSTSRKWLIKEMVPNQIVS